MIAASERDFKLGINVRVILITPDRIYVHNPIPIRRGHVFKIGHHRDASIVED